MIKGDSINEIIQKVCKLLLRQGHSIEPRGLKTLELSNFNIELKYPERSICTLPNRKLSKKYLHAELNWYKSGELHIAKIRRFSSMWDKLADDYGYVNSNYGYWAKIHTNDDNISQWEWCKKELTKDRNSRRAVINYNQVDHKYWDVKDFPCTMFQQFYIRNEKLYSTVCMRSNDLIYGFCYDVPYFTLLQRELAQKLGCKVGSYRHFATSMHVYERHFEMITKIAKEI